MAVPSALNSQPSAVSMQVCGLFVKSQAGQPVRSQRQMQLLAGLGIHGDIQAKPGNPRQILIVDKVTLDTFGLQPSDLRENILLNDGLAHLASGQTLQIGDALIRLMFRCEPCAFLESLQPGLMKRIKNQRGWLGMVVADGTIAIGAPVQLTNQCFPVVSDVAKERFYQFVATIPRGNVVTTQDVILALGVTASHYRTLPGFIKRAPVTLPVHRVVASDRSLLSQHLPHQADLLLAEGIEILNGKVCSQYCWPRTSFYPISIL